MPYICMKKLLFIFILCWIPGIGMSIGLEDAMNAVIQVESGGNPTAKSGCYVGILQLSPIAVRECNNILGKKKYTYKDRYNPEKSKEMWWIIQGHHNPNGDIEHAIRLWKGGPKYTKRSTERYYRKVLKILYMNIKD